MSATLDSMCYFLKQGRFSATVYGHFISKPLLYKWPPRITGLTMFFFFYIKDFLKIEGLFSLKLVCFEHCFDYKSSTG